MNKRTFIAILAAVFISATLYSQEKKSESKEGAEAAGKQKMTVYQEIILEDFETTPYTDKNITFNVTSDQEARLAIRTDLPAYEKSKKYLGIKMKSRGGDIFIIKPAKEIILDKYCKSISFWIYGKKTLGELSFMLQDTRQNNHKLIIIPTVDFLGWKQVTINLGKRIAQEEDFLNQKKTMKLINIQYRTASSKERPSAWQFLYLDDITAVVRDRYTDKQSDEW
ncbi:MAG TPA: flagellar filament outer layer protein FlaA [Spirochaetota bacterium]|nr:hypothetical protein [Spirochaetota bacterium]HOD14296.1 flagellar filament outer layer protein FlaA [Spirochaetota bacterium]HPG49256.1 flagellar filament outer layer protein FlaA [Spirochaetota bacterium]HPN13662.1 flagellar filament outer layer protein FlaA [Spirochaetota bacterium]HQL82304.1 flagellar filament outer layer protein FlaA [Spirochaetota bacterium]